MTDPLLAAQYRLTSRDLVLLGWLAEHKTLTTAQIAHALFPSSRVAQERLLKLTKAGVLDRFRPFRDVGTNPYHYLLTQLGEEIAAVQQGREQPPRRDAARRRRWQLTNRANLPHLLAVNQFFVDLAGHARTHPGYRQERWWSSAHCQRPDSFAHLWPRAVRSAHLYNATVAADGHGVWTFDSPGAGTSGARSGISGRSLVPFFLEVDLGTEDHARLGDKLVAYQRFTAITGYMWPVLYWFASTTRERNFHTYLDSRPAPMLPSGVGTAAGLPPVATASSDRTRTRGLSPADEVWWLHPRPDFPGAEREGLMALVDLEFTVRQPQFDDYPEFEPFAPLPSRATT